MELDSMLWDVSAEQSVIGSILLTHACLPEVARELRPGDFRLEADRAIYEAALALERDGSKVDPMGDEIPFVDEIPAAYQPAVRWMSALPAGSMAVTSSRKNWPGMCRKSRRRSLLLTASGRTISGEPLRRKKCGG